jgi:hypothetical protein
MMLRKFILPFYQRPISRRHWIALVFLLVLGIGLWAGCGWAAGPHSNPTRTPVYYRPANGQAAQALNLYITEEGAYELTPTDLQAVGAAFALEQAALTWRGQPVPVEIIGAGSEARLRFYGHPSDSAYTAENMYQLQAGVPLTMTRVSPSAFTATSTTYTATLRVEQNLVYAPQATGGETWFWQVLPAPSTNTFEVTMPQVGSDSARLRLGVWSNTQAEITPDHHLQASLNGQLVLDATWDGQGVQILEAEISAGLLRSGANQVEINVPGDTGVAAERSYLDWIEIQSSAAAAGDFALLDGSGSPVQFSGDDLTIWQVDGVTETLRVLGGDAGVIVPGESGQRYLVVSPKGFRTPRMQPIALTPDLRKLSPATYLAFGPDDLLTASQPLLDWRSQHGLSTAAIPLQAVYDQFGGGFPEPQAIQLFLEYAAENWPQPPRYVLLLGDFTFDLRGYTTPPEANRLPAFFIQTYFGGETASDVPFADLDGDNLPDLALGRLPARTPAEVQAYVEKVLAYEQQTDTAWRTRLLAVADGQDASFAYDAQVFIDQFTNPIFEKNLFSPPAGAEDANLQIATAIEEGYGIVSYFGHGSVNMWGKDRLFTTEDVAALKNADHLLVVINMNCLTGLFTHPKVISLAETLLWHVNGGAVAVLAPTSLTLPSDQALLSGSLAKQISANPELALGDHFLAAQRLMPVNASGANEVLLTFLYFGDPALHPWGK